MSYYIESNGEALVIDPLREIEPYISTAKKTNSKIAKTILTDYTAELKNFKQICPIEMLDKLENPVTFEINKKKIS